MGCLVPREWVVTRAGRVRAKSCGGVRDFHPIGVGTLGPSA